MKISIKGREIDLTVREAEIFRFLVTNKGLVVPREKMIAEIYKADLDTRVIDVYVGYLRNKISPKAKERNKAIKSIRGYGYSLSKDFEFVEIPEES